MASSYSSDLKLELMVTGEKSGLWGDITNTNLTILQQAIAGYEEISIAGGAQTTALTFSNGTTSNGKNAVIKFTGTITGNQVVTIPDTIEKTYIISNGTTGAFTVEFKTVSGTGVTFGTTDKSTKILFSDGTNIVDTGTVSLTGVQTLTNKTLTSPTINDPIINEINDSNGNEEIIFSTTASAVNEITVKNAATTAAPEISATGDDTDVDLKITPKGAGNLILDGIEFPNADGSSGQVLQTDGSGVLSFGTISSYTDTDALDLFNASGSAPVYACRAWVNFNGSGTPSIRGSGNVSSITDHGTGDYTVNFTTAMPDVNYSFVATSDNNEDGAATDSFSTPSSRGTSTYLTSSVRFSVVRLRFDTQQFIDATIVTFAIFR
jgi:hypothetical protein